MAVNAGRDICLLDPVAAAERDARMRSAATAGKLPGTTFRGMPPLSGGLFTRRRRRHPVSAAHSADPNRSDKGSWTTSLGRTMPRARAGAERRARGPGCDAWRGASDLDRRAHHAVIAAPAALADWIEAHGGDSPWYVRIVMSMQSRRTWMKPQTPSKSCANRRERLPEARTLGASRSVSTRATAGSCSECASAAARAALTSPATMASAIA